MKMLHPLEQEITRPGHLSPSTPVLHHHMRQGSITLLVRWRTFPPLKKERPKTQPWHPCHSTVVHSLSPNRELADGFLVQWNALKTMSCLQMCCLSWWIMEPKISTLLTIESSHNREGISLWSLWLPPIPKPNGWGKITHDSCQRDCTNLKGMNGKHYYSWL